MTSSARESSWDTGQPVMFIRFARGVRKWFYTTSDRIETLNGDTYTPAAISRGAIHQGSERAQNNITITLPASLGVAGNWRPYPPADAVVVTIWVRHVGETDTIADWTGRVVGPKFNGAELELTCEPTLTKARRLGMQRTWQRGCGLVLYQQGVGQCNLNKATRAVAATLTGMTGLTLTATAFGTLPDGRFAGGFITWAEGDGLIESRSIRSHTGTSIVVDYGATALAAGLAVTAYPGCAHTWADCAYFGNQPNYGGDLWIPRDDPYSGDPVW